MPVGQKRHRARIVPLYDVWQGSPATIPNNGVKTGTWSIFFNNAWQLARKDLPSAYSDHRHLPNPPWTSKESVDDETHLGPPWTTGGPFTKLKVTSDSEIVKGSGDYDTGTNVLPTVMWGPQKWKYSGGFLPLWPVIPGVVSEDYSVDSKIWGPGATNIIPALTGWGPKAWALSAPKIEMANGFVSLAEARDIPRMLKISSSVFHSKWGLYGGNINTVRQVPKQVSDTFLNHQFGWSPFLSDLGKFYTAHNEMSSYMSRMGHGNDKWKVYRRTLLDDYQSSKLAEGNGVRYRPSFEPTEWAWVRPGTQSKWELHEEKFTLVTSSGSFKWYKPEFEDLKSGNINVGFRNIGIQMAAHGIRISPSNIWRATPWTWLIDWGLNVGRSIDRLSEYLLDGVVSKYLYVMQHTVRRLVLYNTIPFRTGDVTFAHYRIIDVKQRAEAGSPYGFDLPWDNFSLRKMAILGALGISRKGALGNPGG